MNTPDRRDELKTVALICLALNDCLCTANLLDIDPVCFENVRNTYRTAIMNLCVCMRIINVCMFINNVCQRTSMGLALAGTRVGRRWSLCRSESRKSFSVWGRRLSAARLSARRESARSVSAGSVARRVARRARLEMSRNRGLGAGAAFW